MKKHNFTREEQKRRVIHRFADWIQKERGEVWATSYKIAAGLDLSPSTHFRAILAEMVAEGLLIQREAPKSGRWNRFEYMLAPDTYTPPAPRKIAFKAGGKPKGQLELWQ